MAQNPNYHESPIAPWYSFANVTLPRQDTEIREGAFTRRVLTYPRPDDERRAVREMMEAGGLLLGQGNPTGNPHTETFTIPVSARPLSHEVASPSVDQLVYGDSSMFFDMGRLLGAVAKAAPEWPLVLEKEIGDNLAIIEFTRRSEPKLLLVPGFETTLAAVEDDDAALLHYAERLHGEFGQQFNENAEYFTEGFRADIR